MTPLIGISTYQATASWGPWSNAVALTPLTYVRAVTAAGGRPLLLAPCELGVAETVAALDGLILCGGPDIDPALYGRAPAPEIGTLAPERDRAESALLRAALHADLPVLGICRGMQLLNIVRGGTLVAHLPAHATRPGTFDVHPVAIELDSICGRALGARAEVHSGHHQGIDRLGERCRATAWAPDGVIEAIELTDQRFAVGALWHPEQGEQMGLFEALLAVSGTAGSLD